MFLKTYNTKFDELIITFTDQSGRPLETDDKLNLTMLINKWKCDNIVRNQEQENMLNDMDFDHLRENIKKELLDIYLDAVKTTSKKVIHKVGGGGGGVNLYKIKLDLQYLSQKMTTLREKRLLKK